jgi:hypothetical protein
MTIYRFVAVRGPGDPPEHTEVAVRYDDESDPTLDKVVGAFVMFLKGVTFEPSSIAKFIDHEAV